MKIELERTARDRELKMFGGLGRTGPSSAQVSVQKTDANLGHQADSMNRGNVEVARPLLNESYRLLSGLLFVGPEINELGILRRWTEVTRDHDNNIDVPALSDVYGRIYIEITALAKKAAE